MTEIEKMLAELALAQQTEATQEQENGTSNFFNFKKSKYFMPFVIGGEYSFRILFPIHEKLVNKAGVNIPLIHKTEHKFYGKSMASITCLSSEYVDGNRGFNKCRTCAATEDMYKNKTNPIDREMYDMFRRQANGFALVYVTGNSISPDTEGEFRFIRYGKGIRADFRKAIFGINEKAPRGTSKVCKASIGASAFSLDNGYDCEISVTSKPDGDKVWPEYRVTFAREATSVPITQADINEACVTTRFFELCTISSEEEIETFYNDYILHYDDVIEDKKSDSKPTTPPPFNMPNKVIDVPTQVDEPLGSEPLGSEPLGSEPLGDEPKAKAKAVVPAVGGVDVTAILAKIKQNQGI